MFCVQRTLRRSWSGSLSVELKDAPSRRFKTRFAPAVIWPKGKMQEVWQGERRGSVLNSKYGRQLCSLYRPIRHSFHSCAASFLLGCYSCHDATSKSFRAAWRAAWRAPCRCTCTCCSGCRARGLACDDEPSFHRRPDTRHLSGGALAPRGGCPVGRGQAAGHSAGANVVRRLPGMQRDVPVTPT